MWKIVRVESISLGTLESIVFNMNEDELLRELTELNKMSLNLRAELYIIRAFETLVSRHRHVSADYLMRVYDEMK